MKKRQLCSVVEAEMQQMLDSSTESDSSTDSGLLRRNLELLRKKTSEKQVTLDSRGKLYIC
jgi:hypothetical protein